MNNLHNRLTRAFIPAALGYLAYAALLRRRHRYTEDDLLQAIGRYQEAVRDLRIQNNDLRMGALASVERMEHTQNLLEQVIKQLEALDHKSHPDDETTYHRAYRRGEQALNEDPEQDWRYEA